MHLNHASHSHKLLIQAYSISELDACSRQQQLYPQNNTQNESKKPNTELSPELNRKACLGNRWRVFSTSAIRKLPIG